MSFETMSGEEFHLHMLKSMKEVTFLNHVMELARAWGWMVDHVFDQGVNAECRECGEKIKECPECGEKLRGGHAKRSMKGAPDIFAMRQHEFFWLELKAEKGKVSAYQVLYMDMLVKAQADVFYARPSDYSKVEELLDTSVYSPEIGSIDWRNVREREIGMMSKREREKLEGLA